MCRCMNVKMHECDKDNCSFKISNLTGLQVHRKIVHGEKLKLGTKRKYCESCDYSTPKNREMRNHMKNCGPHAQMFTCKKTNCNFTVSNKTSLKVHEAKCENDDPLSVVEKSLEKSTASLKEKKQKCDKCDFTSKYIRYLKLHRKNAHGENDQYR